jgi:hypothetical protein
MPHSSACKITKLEARDRHHSREHDGPSQIGPHHPRTDRENQHKRDRWDQAQDLEPLGQHHSDQQTDQREYRHG